MAEVDPCQASKESSAPAMPGGSPGVRERAQNYEASVSQVASDPPPPPTSTRTSQSAVEKLRGHRSGGGEVAGLARQRWTLANISEQRVLKAGVHCLRDTLVDGNTAELMELPRRRDGALAVMQGSFLRRLLADELELKVCSQCDVSAAQSDLRYLSTQQLLAVRARTLDFSTDSDSHSAHRNFLFSLDSHLFEKVARQCLRGTAEAKATPRPERLRALGIRMALVLGAMDVLAKGWNEQDEAPLPSCWALKLDENDWKGCSAALFHSQELWLEVVPDEGPGLERLAPDNQVAVVTDRSVGTGMDRRLHWEIVALEPQTDDIIAELNRKEGAELEKLSNELSSVIRQRCSSRMEALGLTPPEATLSLRPTPCTARSPATPDKGKVAAAVSRINKATPPGSWRPQSLCATPEVIQGAGSELPRKLYMEEAGEDSMQVPPAVAPALEGPSAAPPPPAAPAVERVAPPPSPLARELGVPPPMAPPVQKAPDESDEVQADSWLPCMCSRSPGKPQVCLLPECFRGIF